MTTSDLSGRTGAHRVVFGFGNNWYRIDLTEDERAEFEQALSRYIDAGQDILTEAQVKERTRYYLPKNERTRIRRWARQHGYTVKDKGRIPSEAFDDFQVLRNGGTVITPDGMTLRGERRANGFVHIVAEGVASDYTPTEAADRRRAYLERKRAAQQGTSGPPVGNPGGDSSFQSGEPDISPFFIEDLDDPDEIGYPSSVTGTLGKDHKGDKASGSKASDKPGEQDGTDEHPHLAVVPDKSQAEHEAAVARMRGQKPMKRKPKSKPNT